MEAVVCKGRGAFGEGGTNAGCGPPQAAQYPPACSSASPTLARIFPYQVIDVGEEEKDDLVNLVHGDLLLAQVTDMHEGLLLRLKPLTELIAREGRILKLAKVLKDLLRAVDQTLGLLLLVS